MIVISGAAGFIASVLTSYLNALDRTDLVLVDDFSAAAKKPNWVAKRYLYAIDRDAFLPWLDKYGSQVKAVFHLGARTDTTEQDSEVFDQLNLHYSQQIWQSCVKYDLPLIYASSAATYGDGRHGYSDRHDLIDQLQPLNPYGHSKQQFDEWVLAQNQHPSQWYGLKFFNVYGPNEYHKGRMASVVFHAIVQIRMTGQMKLFRSHRPNIEHGHQQRDFIYVRDVVRVLWWLYENRPTAGIYNLGTGQARTFLDLVHSTFAALDLNPKIEFIDTPMDIRETYQYYTEAEMDKLANVGCPTDFYSLEDGVAEYVRLYMQEDRWL